MYCSMERSSRSQSSLSTSVCLMTLIMTLLFCNEDVQPKIVTGRFLLLHSTFTLFSCFIRWPGGKHGCNHMNLKVFIVFSDTKPDANRCWVFILLHALLYSLEFSRESQLTKLVADWNYVLQFGHAYVLSHYCILQKQMSFWVELFLKKSTYIIRSIF